MFFTENHDSDSIVFDKKRHLGAFFDHLSENKLYNLVKMIIIKR